ncbi:carbohydrate ABC transporter permease [Cellulomonas fimi]|uniref:Binding-protein-dependent transport systems inner membrane component n=1 Tax=Cellulomonas fimi (strain ATCC 484 / DSM 20113 / JCM 1341 / CCUG 24087 / LMG 16345 / NBRC 15513 / NCIMB 8980 / NCTC 7547 / NRS-133) TaxID=590998 RepID=F4H8B1_CELFA|nr:binding-protein-dependent transport systems inner membrane component [Cellulomonas fimi ATCC 484]NNH07480.1 sugar ABC transporter permease [Cellulomonas fimi]VEH26953.1 sn-glycerol-3-phosphate transport system permease protein ugpA [Cellulomonas fimi]
MTTLASPRAADTRPARTHRRPRRRTAAPYVFLAPALTLFALFLALPIGYALYLSFRTVEVKGLGLGAGARTEVWAGFDNYTRALDDPEFLASVGRVGLYGLLLVPTMLGLALLFALLLDARRTRAKGFSRVSIFLPYAVPAVIASLLWGFLYLPRVSPFYFLFDKVGWDAPQILSSQLVVFAIANIGLWGGVGFNMIVIYTALKAIPSELYEAARLDGASELVVALRIKVPIVLPSLVLTFLFSMIATLQVFAEPMTLRPLTNTISTTWSPLMKVYRDAFTRDDIYSAAATSVVIALATFALSYLFLRVVQDGRAFSQESR